MLSLKYGLIRLDIEDYLTPEADGAVVVMARALERWQIPASFGWVGEKVAAMVSRGYQGVLKELAQGRSIGYHSMSHSRHPTLAERMEVLSYEDGVKSFIASETLGVQAVRDRIAMPRYFTQPGGNWVPQAIDALPALGIYIFFTEALNSYFTTSPEPVWVGEVLHVALPTLAPRPFMLGLPANLAEAVDAVEQGVQALPAGGAFCVVTHPTELVSAEFWDAVNFGHGQTRETLIPAPLRSPAERAQAYAALEQYLSRVSKVSGVEWIDVQTLAAKISPPPGRRRLRRDAIGSWLAAHGLSPGRIGEEAVSAADLAFGLALGVTAREVPELVIPRCQAPGNWAPEPSVNMAPRARDQVLEWARCWVRKAHTTNYGWVPGFTEISLDVASAYWWGLWQRPGVSPVIAEPLPLGFLDHVKPPSQLHWNWPIFAPGFEAYHLWRQARRLAWMLQPVNWK